MSVENMQYYGNINVNINNINDNINYHFCFVIKVIIINNRVFLKFIIIQILKNCDALILSTFTLSISRK